ncbi:mitochondrion protein [Ascosphaera apis ARSEF 7405]|uniref:Mitochondrion protein n=1 Tax=Ascosphaera apis ARSEF 7405 TaxID=392613 RepID=A0A168BUF1_9EURO|nr:mitochondrion protein [Ascosphaera apis ARSEF 7405]
MASKAASTKRIVVAGGSGFVGEPDWRTLFHESSKPRWAKNVEWAKADILKPGTYKDFLADKDAMVHSMGILLEADYKGIISGREGAFGIMRKMLKTKSDVASPENMSVTYDVINRDSATSLAAESQIAKIPTFVYISAAASAPFLPWGYLNSKREAEDLISQEYASLRSIFMRPPFIYDPTRPISLPIAAGGYLGHEANLLSKGKLKEWVGAMAQKPMKVDVVGEAVVEAIDDEKVKGVVGPEEMEDMGVKGWRKSMI